MHKKRTGVLIKCLVYGAFAVVLLVLQSSRATGVSLWTASANFMPFLVAALALYENPYMAGGVGFFAGLLLSVHSSTIEGLASFWLAIFGVAYSYLAELFFRNNIVLSILGGMGCLAVGELCKYVFYYMLVHGVGFGAGMLTLLGSLILSVPFGVLVCYIVRWISRKFSEDER